MYDARGDILYVGKAKSLKKRVGSYFRSRAQNAKTQALVSKITKIDVTLTATEAEALILEHNLIKQQRPPYNVLLRDDKTYPYIYLSEGSWPEFSFHRGAKKKRGRYFGPFPNSTAARETLALVQKVFRLHPCGHQQPRSTPKPCFFYQIDLCSGSCVGAITAEEHAENVRRGAELLEGRSEALTNELIQAMNRASETLEFEKAARFRDQLEMIRTVQSEQIIDSGSANIDVIGSAIDGDESCVHMLFVRLGRIVASRSYYPKLSLMEAHADLLSSFISQHYLNAPEAVLPKQIYIASDIDDRSAQEAALQQHCGRKLSIRYPKRGRGVDWVKMANKTAEQNLLGKKAGQRSYERRLKDLNEALELTGLERLECYDISHTQGALTVASCVVFDADGPNKQQYRRFNIEGITGGDDYAAMEQVLRRRFTRLQSGEIQMPDMVVIDGGKGQIGKAREVFAELAVSGVEILGVAKGTTRKSGWERFFIGDDNKEIVLDSSRPGFHLLQHIRDEAHRFAITGHKARRAKKMIESPLEDIPGVGPKRRKALLDHFGGFKGIERASLNDLSRVEGISKQMAESIYDYFHQ